MGVLNEILAGRLNRALQKFTGIKGPPPTPQLSSEIMPVVAMFWGAENRYIESWNRFAFVTNANAPGAGNRLGIRLRNPNGSGVISVIEKITVLNTDVAAQTFQLFHGGTQGDLNAGVVAATTLDLRGGTSASNSLASNQNNNAAVGASQVSLAVCAVNVTFDLINTDIQELPLSPNDQYSVYAGVNQAAGFVIQWRERVLEDSEKT